MKKIVLVEDDRELSQGISYALKQEGYLTTAAYTLKEAEFACVNGDPDLILLDVNLPDGEGFAFCRWLKMRKEIPVLFLTARDLEEDALYGYEAGADDYITKPFSIHILLKKIDVFLKRSGSAGTRVYDDGFLRIDFDRAQAEADGVECQLTPTEFRILLLFAGHPGQLLTYSVMLERLWDCGGQFVDKHTLAVNINRLRGKIEDGEHKYISNVYGMGYQWLG